MLGLYQCLTTIIAQFYHTQTLISKIQSFPLFNRSSTILCSDILKHLLVPLYTNTQFRLILTQQFYFIKNVHKALCHICLKMSATMHAIGMPLEQISAVIENVQDAKIQDTSEGFHDNKTIISSFCICEINFSHHC